ncbi:hypothetical protein HanPSC8_Chr17g0785771 [Helianthus annuus]|nr:hypothetical protein HanPSC8_Chr17g0785771 [Helianthus annuus]
MVVFRFFVAAGLDGGSTSFSFPGRLSRVILHHKPHTNSSNQIHYMKHKQVCNNPSPHLFHAKTTALWNPKTKNRSIFIVTALFLLLIMFYAH